MTDRRRILDAFEIQAAYCTANDAPITALVCRALIGALDRKSGVGQAVLDWQGNPVADGLVLRLVGGLHALWLAGRASELDGLFAGKASLQEASVAVANVLKQCADDLLPWLASPPQTNEPGRSAALMTGLLHIAARHGPRMELLEIGSSAGLNLLIDRFAFDLGGVKIGPGSSPVLIRPDWRGPPPPDHAPDICGVRGCDIQPIDATLPENEQRLLGYVWQDHPQRIDRIARVIALQRKHPVTLARADAAEWVEARLAEPQAEGVTRVLMHSIMWQYLEEDGKARIMAAMESAGSRATDARPLGWVAVEADRSFNRHDIIVRSWPGHGDAHCIGHAHAHGFWVEHLA